MSIDWASEHFVRLFTRETEDDLVLSWEARAVWNELLKRFDKHGFIKAKHGARTIAMLIRYPVEVVERALPDLLEDGRIVNQQDGYFAPNYQDANYTPRSAPARKAYSRERSQIGPRPVEDSLTAADDQIGPCPVESSAGAPVQSGQSKSGNRSTANGLSRESIESHAKENSRDKMSIRSDQGRSEHTQSRARARSDGRRTPLPPDWTPCQQARERAQELELDCDAEAAEFAAYWRSEGKSKADWNQAFLSRLEQRGQQRRRASNWQRAGPPAEDRDIRDL